LMIWILLCVLPPTLPPMYPASFPQPTASQDARISRESSARKTTSRSNPLESGRDWKYRKTFELKNQCIAPLGHAQSRWLLARRQQGDDERTIRLRRWKLKDPEAQGAQNPQISNTKTWLRCSSFQRIRKIQSSRHFGNAVDATEELLAESRLWDRKNREVGRPSRGLYPHIDTSANSWTEKKMLLEMQSRRQICYSGDEDAEQSTTIARYYGTTTLGASNSRY
jgi:hypothetical protein